MTKYNRPAWPEQAKFSYGDRVQRAPVDNAPPRWNGRGYVVGWFDAGGGIVGYVIAPAHDPGYRITLTEPRLETWCPDD